MYTTSGVLKHNVYWRHTATHCGHVVTDGSYILQCKVEQVHRTALEQTIWWRTNQWKNKSVFNYYVRWKRGSTRIRPPLLQQSIDISPIPVRWAHSSKPAVEALLLCNHAGTDRRTDGRTPYRFIDPAPHTMSAVPISGVSLYAWQRIDHELALYTGWSDVTESMVKIRTLFCGYNTT